MLDSTILSTVIHSFEYLPWYAWVIISFGVAAKIFGGVFKPNHLFFVIQSHIALNKLNRIGQTQGPAAQFFYLRNQNPFLFEELILTALKRNGNKIKRNSRYTGDGGIDGQCWIEGQHYLIQAKRYRNHINAEDVRAFSQLCKTKGTKGMFVHTGKTGKKSRQEADRVTIVSGNNLLTLLLGI